MPKPGRKNTKKSKLKRNDKNLSSNVGSAAGMKPEKLSIETTSTALPASLKKRWDKILWELIAECKRPILIGYGIIGFLVLMAEFYDYTKKQLMSEHDRFVEENTFQGILLTPKVLEDSDLKVRLGYLNVVFDRRYLLDGSDYLPLFRYCQNGSPFMNLHYVMQGNRLFVTDTIYDLETNKIAAIINQNEWTLFKGNFLNYEQNDSSLEVIDNRGRVALNLQFRKNVLVVHGYFISDKSVTIVEENGFLACVPRHDTTGINEAIRNIKPIFNHEKRTSFKWIYWLFLTILVFPLLIVLLRKLYIHFYKKIA